MSFPKIYWKFVTAQKCQSAYYAKSCSMMPNIGRQLCVIMLSMMAARIKMYMHISSAYQVGRRRARYVYQQTLPQSQPGP
ncbi:MAG TPA: hypothetical protein DDW97_02710 [Anaerolineaceae bacterium]|nr:hypothetical protein [Anaerolineaceae bacterium]